MEYELVTVLKAPTKVLCFGGVTPSKIIKNPEVKPKELILMIPGNPGMVGVFELFGQRLYEKTKLPIWVVSQAGHENLPSPSLSKNPNLYNVEGQTRHKKEFIDSYLKGVKLRFIGHSIGSKIVLNILESPEYSPQIESAYCLFPTIERMAVTSEGAKIVRLINYGYWPLMILLMIFGSLPLCLQRLLITIYFYTQSYTIHHREEFVRFLNPRIVSKVLHMADDEMKNIMTRDDDVIKKNVQRLRFLYTSLDNWSPKEYYEDLKEKVPNVRAEYDEVSGWIHAFGMKDSIPVADKVANWVIQDQQDSTILKSFDQL